MEKDYETVLMELPGNFARNSQATIDVLMMQYDFLAIGMRDKCSCILEDMLGIFFLYPDQLGMEFPDRKEEAELLFSDLRTYLDNYVANNHVKSLFRSKEQLVLGVKSLCSVARQYMDRWQTYNELFGE